MANGVSGRNEATARFDVVIRLSDNDRFNNRTE